MIHKGKLKRISLIMAVIMVVMACWSTPAYAADSYTYWTNRNTPNYTTTNLNVLYDSGWNYQWSNRIYYAGCFVTSYAMILNNLDKVTASSVTDIRTGSTGYLTADPFTVTFANSNFASISSSGNYYLSSYTSDPVLTYPSRIASNFDATYVYVDLTDNTEAEKAYNLAYYINQYPQGIGIHLSNSSGTHCVVGIDQTYRNFGSRSLMDEDIQIVEPTIVTSKNYLDVAPNTVFAMEQMILNQNVSNRAITVNNTDSVYDDYFTVCDPVSYTGCSGDGVLFSDSWAGSVYTVADIQYLRIMY